MIQQLGTRRAASKVLKSERSGTQRTSRRLALSLIGIVLLGSFPASADSTAVCVEIDKALVASGPNAQSYKDDAAAATVNKKALPTGERTMRDYALNDLLARPSPFEVKVSSQRLPGGGAGWITFTEKSLTNADINKLCLRGYWRAVIEGTKPGFNDLTIRELTLVDKSNPGQLKAVFTVDPVTKKQKLDRGWFEDEVDFVFVGRLESGAAGTPATQFSYAMPKVPVSNPEWSKIAAVLFVVIVYFALAIATRNAADFKDLKHVNWIAFFFSPIRITAGIFGEASISQLQVFLFTFIVAGLLFYVWLRAGLLGNISTDLLSLLGISAVGAAGAKFTAVLKADLDPAVHRYIIGRGWYAWAKISGPGQAKIGQLLLIGGRLDVYKLQVAIFTIVVAAYVVTSGENDLGGVKIPETILYLIGISQGVYIAGKAITDHKTRLEEAVKKMKDNEDQINDLKSKEANAQPAEKPALLDQITAKTREFEKAARLAIEDFAELYALEPPKVIGPPPGLDPNLLRP
ncbi:MAG: hypothetical protein QOF14_5950 [Hyphomicrobiales bacterium]|jgi:hypothetical protein|nr:hypothetical protein [Hyphomicrobiales bacterium]